MKSAKLFDELEQKLAEREVLFNALMDIRESLHNVNTLNGVIHIHYILKPFDMAIDFTNTPLHRQVYTDALLRAIQIAVDLVD